jgi:hypothetical protein
LIHHYKVVTFILPQEPVAGNEWESLDLEQVFEVETFLGDAEPLAEATYRPYKNPIY